MPPCRLLDVTSTTRSSHESRLLVNQESVVGRLSLREGEGASQAVFARYLNVTTGLISQWERGEKHPQGASLKLLSLVAKHGLGAVA